MKCFLIALAVYVAGVLTTPFALWVFVRLSQEQMPVRRGRQE